MFTNAGITVTATTLEPDVKSVLTKVELGEVDAGVVYVTDVKAAGAKVTGIEIPADVNASTSYPISALAASEQPSLAASFVAYVVSDQGRQCWLRQDSQHPEPVARKEPCERPRCTSTGLSRRERDRRVTGGVLPRSAPWPLLVPALVAIAFLVLPLVGLIVRAPWGDSGRSCAAPARPRRLRLSLWTSTVATGIALVIGVPLAWVLARTACPG